MRAIEATTALSLSDAETAVRAALSEEGFGVLTEIDVAATLKAKLGVERRPLKILGACNPALADQALAVDPSVSLVLPCNVVLEPVANGTRVAAADPRDLLTADGLVELAGDAAARLERAISSLAAPPGG
ncbi:DUF302 domain-containing protein [Actinomarinicola tropica]|uniref:DUF302 domain-containing protein n=1 Tax=Actinomarinicola tropica TaxID=2789776 RepID=A0A5Q2RIC3_9ACTN|nr:DUF302 domain-containing protein [Actinomarinicola tropica]